MHTINKLTVSSYYALKSDLACYPHKVVIAVPTLTNKLVEAICQVLSLPVNPKQKSWGFRHESHIGIEIYCADPVDSALLTLHLNELERIGK